MKSTKGKTKDLHTYNTHTHTHTHSHIYIYIYIHDYINQTTNSTVLRKYESLYSVMKSP